MNRPLVFLVVCCTILLASCRGNASQPPSPIPSPTAPPPSPFPQAPLPITATRPPSASTSAFAVVDGSRPMTFPEDFGAHPAFRSEWWYYTGNLDTPQGRHFGFELTIFRVAMRPPTTPPPPSAWKSQQVYFAHFALSDVSAEAFHAFQRFSRPGPGLAGAQAQPYRVWLEDWGVTAQPEGTYHLFAEQNDLRLDLLLEDQTGPVLHGQNGYSRKGDAPTNASYYYSLPRLRAQGTIHTPEGLFTVTGLAWMDHEFSSSVLGEKDIGWDWFALQFDDGYSLMLYQLRRADGSLSPWNSGTLIAPDGTPHPFTAQDFTIEVLDTWLSPATEAVYPAEWRVRVPFAGIDVRVTPWMNAQELNVSPTIYWEGAVHTEGSHTGNGYVELTGYAGNQPQP